MKILVQRNTSLRNIDITLSYTSLKTNCHNHATPNRKYNNVLDTENTVSKKYFSNKYLSEKYFKN